MKENAITKKRKGIIIAILALLIVAVTVVVLIVCNNRSAYEFTLSERDVMLEADGTLQLELVPDDAKQKYANVKAKWESSNPSVATVDKHGVITAKGEGETRITAVVERNGQEFSSYCIVTVKGKDLEYSTYKLRYFTQHKDRSGYEVVEESYERLVGSNVEMTVKDASKLLPAYYTLNQEKSVLKGVVKEQRGMCVLEVYYDVAEVTYSVDYYYESAAKLGKYTDKETKKFKAYAFSEVTAPDNNKTGFERNEKVKGTVLKNSSVVSGTKLKAYYDRIRSKVTITYVSDRKTATYTNIYGVGLVDVPETALKDSLAPYYVVSYINGVKKAITSDMFKNMTADTKIEFRVDGVGFKHTDGALVNTSESAKTSSYAYLKGKGETIYLSATYNTTGSFTNMFGITLKSGGTSREIRFNGKGLGIMKNHTNASGVLREGDSTYYYNVPARGNTTYVFAQNMNGASGTKVNSVIQNMLTNPLGGSYDVVWAIWEGTLYAMVEGEVSIALPLTLLDASWTADKQYEIGFSTFDTQEVGDDLKITNVALAYNEKAEEKLVTNKRITTTSEQNMIYEPFTGSYMPSSGGGSSYIYGKETDKNIGISADVHWIDMYNSASATGVSVQVGGKSVQYVVQGVGLNTQIRQQENHGWTNVAYITRTVMKYTETAPGDENGAYNVKAFVKDGYFYILYNDKEAVCVNMQSIFHGYTPDMKAAVGICTWDASSGQSYFANVKTLSEKDIEKVAVKQWKYYINDPTVDAFDFVDGTVDKLSELEQNLTFMNTAKEWELEGTLTRPERVGDERVGLMVGFKIVSGNKSVRILAQQNGLVRVLNGWTTDHTTKTWTTGEVLEVYEHRTGQTLNAFNDAMGEFFFFSGRELPFRAVIYDDVLYVWFDGEICWRAPLTEEAFGGFAKDSEYSLTVQIDFGVRTGGIKDLALKMGYQVTDNKEFLTHNNKAYTVAEATEQINANLDRWGSSADMKYMRVTGKFAERIESTEQHTQAAYAYMPAASDTYLNATYSTQKDQATLYGVTIKHGADSRQLYFRRGGVAVFAQHSYSTQNAIPCASNGWEYVSVDGDSNKKNSFIWAQNTVGLYGMVIQNAIENMTQSKADDFDVTWAITDNILYGSVDGFVCIKWPLETLCADWTADKKYEYQLGVAIYDPYNNGDVIFSDIACLTGEKALAMLVKDKELPGLENSDMYYEALTGAYVPNVLKGSGKYIYNNAVAGTQAVQATITMVDKANTSSASGITVKSGDQSAQIVVEGHNKKVRVQLNHSWGLPTTVTTLLPEDVKAYDDKGVCKVTAVVKNSKLYILYDGKQAGSIELYKLLPGYQATDAIQLGIYAWDTHNGMTKFTDIRFLNSEEAGKIKTDNYKWDVEFFVSDNWNSNATIDEINGVINKNNNNMINVNFHGYSSTWEVTGTMERTDAKNAGDLLTGFRITSGDKRLRLWARNKGICICEPWNTSLDTGVNQYAFNEDISKFTSWTRTEDKMHFKAVIANDVLYVWFGLGDTYDESKLVPSWRIPLRDETTIFGALPSGNYKFGLEIADAARQGNFNNLKVKTGQEVNLQAVSEFEKYYDDLDF